MFLFVFVLDDDSHGGRSESIGGQRNGWLLHRREANRRNSQWLMGTPDPSNTYPRLIHRVSRIFTWWVTFSISWMGLDPGCWKELPLTDGSILGLHLRGPGAPRTTRGSADQPPRKQPKIHGPCRAVVWWTVFHETDSDRQGVV